MFGGMALTTISAFWFTNINGLEQWIVGHQALSLVLVGIWLILSIGFKPLISFIPAPISAILFIVYSIFTGASLAFVVSQYSPASVFFAFLASSILFGVMVLFAFMTKIDLSKTRFLSIAGFVAIFIFTAINYLFFKSPTIDWVISIGAILLFAFSTAEAIQRIKEMAEGNDEKIKNRLVIIGAATLYTSFVSLFLRILRLMGKSKADNKK